MRRLLFAGLAAIVAAALTACSGPAPEAAPSPTARPSASFNKELWLIVVSDGSTDELTLEWTGGPTNATKWQYRTNHRINEPWGPWTDFPGSGATTRSHTFTGLESGSGHGYEVRAVLGTVPGRISNNAHGITREAGEYPSLSPNTIAEGDGVTEWRLHYLNFVVTIPKGVRVLTGLAQVAAEHSTTIPMTVISPAGGSGLLFDPSGHIVNRYVPPPSDGNPNASSLAADQGSVLDKIIESRRWLD